MAEVTDQAVDDFFASGGESVPEGLALPETKPEPEAAPEARAPETPAEPKPEARPEPEKRGLTPDQMAAVLAERERRQAAEAREREIMALLKQLKGEPEKRPDDSQPPDPNDPIATIDWLRKQVETTQKTLAEQREMTEKQRAIGELGNRVTAAEAEFRKAKPDYDDAADFTRARLLDFYALQGIPADQAQQFLAESSVQMLRNFIQAGKNPAEGIYELAGKFGYAPKAADPKPAEDPMKKVEQKLDQIRRGQDAAKGKGGQGEEDVMTAEKLADLDGAAFDSAWKKMFGTEKSFF